MGTLLDWHILSGTECAVGERVQSMAIMCSSMICMQALAQDQRRALQELLISAFGDHAPNVEVYDGDTLQVHARPSLLTMLHAAVDAVCVVCAPYMTL